MTQRCKEKVLVRDTYRYTGRTTNGLELVYKLRQCKRTAGPDGYCWQHRPLKEKP